eukprot:symbB.v1.2.022914.t1/scaffold2052.1/size91004/9
MVYVLIFCWVVDLERQNGDPGCKMASDLYVQKAQIANFQFHRKLRSRTSMKRQKGRRSLEQLLHCARLHAENERLRQASELCTEALHLLWSKLSLLPPPHPECGRSISLASSSSSAPAPVAVVWRGIARDVVVPDESCGILCELLCLRASAYAQMQQYADALVDAEEVISIQPTCADGYYWQHGPQDVLKKKSQEMHHVKSGTQTMRDFRTDVKSRTKTW